MFLFKYSLLIKKEIIRKALNTNVGCLLQKKKSTNTTRAKEFTQIIKLNIEKNKRKKLQHKFLKIKDT